MLVLSQPSCDALGVDISSLIYFPFQLRSGCLPHSLGASVTFFEPKRFKVCLRTGSPVGEGGSLAWWSASGHCSVKAPLIEMFLALGRVIFET